MASDSDLITATENGGPPAPTTASAARITGATTIYGEAFTNWPTVTKVFFVTGTPTTDAEGNPVIDPSTLCLWYGIVTGDAINDMVLTGSPEGSDPGNNEGDIIQMAPTSSWAQALYEGLTAQHNTEGGHVAIINTGGMTTDTLLVTETLVVEGNATFEAKLILQAALIPAVTTTPSAATVTPTASGPGYIAVTDLAVALTIEEPTGTPVQGQLLTIFIHDNGTGQGLTWNAIYVPIQNVTLPSSTSGGAVYATCRWNGVDGTWDVIGAGQR